MSISKLYTGPDAAVIIESHIGDASLLTKSRTKGLSSRADLAPPTMRPGCTQADAW